MSTFRQLTEIFTPANYNLTIDLDRQNRKFTGKVIITGKSLRNGLVALHSKDLAIDSVIVNESDATFRLEANDELVINSQDVKAGNDTTIHVDFSGEITDAMHGLYPSYYEVDGEKKEILATQFESHHAREVFPCIDEPAGKATFDVTLATEDDITVLGNTPIQTQESKNGKLITTFGTTPIMSPYLLAFVAGEMQKKSTVSKNGVEVNVYATHAHPSESLDFALDTGAKIVDFYSDYFDTDYPLQKCDHVALPDFASGAMENWGLITYREVALLAGKNTTIHSKRYIATVIAHELAHQWFGNLVTMQWWDDLWLNESFATAMEYIAVDNIYPEWNIWRDFSANETVMALRRDSLDGVQSVHVEVDHPDKISTLFDGAIVYAKGARLLRMIHHYVGDKAFQAGLKSYFDKHAYQNTVGQNLWDALSESSGEDIGKIMNTWISQPGFPVVSVEKNTDSLTLSQKQLFVGPHEPSTRLWPIPLSSNDANLPRLLDTESATFDRSQSAVRLNHGDTAHFISHYDNDLMGEILAELESGKLDEVTRLQLLHEQTLLIKSGNVPAGNLIPLLDSYSSEVSEPVWSIISVAIAELRHILHDSDQLESLLKNFVVKLAHRQYSRLGWYAKANESEDDTTLRSTVIGLTLYGEDADAINKAHDIYLSSDIEAIDPEIRSLVLSNAVKNFDEDSIVSKKLLDIYAKTSDGDIQGDIASALTSTRRDEVIDILLEAMTNRKIVRTQDSTRWYAYLVRNKYSRTKAWQWLQNNWGWVEESFRGDKSIDYYPRYTANSLNTEEQLAEYKKFFEPFRDDQTLTRAISIGEGEIEGRIQYINRSLPSVSKALEDQSSKDN